MMEVVLLVKIMMQLWQHSVVVLVQSLLLVVTLFLVVHLLVIHVQYLVVPALKKMNAVYVMVMVVLVMMMKLMMVIVYPNLWNRQFIVFQVLP
jgi:hypothetical protein